jgi:hypothetical protein
MNEGEPPLIRRFSDGIPTDFRCPLRFWAIIQQAHDTRIHEARSQCAKQHPILASGHIMEVRMTSSQTARLLEMRQAGKRFAQISADLGISKNTLKSFCRRVDPDNDAAETTTCTHCGTPMAIKGKLRFCSGGCRYAWSYSHSYPRRLQCGREEMCVLRKVLLELCV